MTEQTDAAEIGPYVGRSIDEVIYDYVMVRGDLTEPYAREQLARIIAAREAAARAEALRGILFRVETACDGYSHLMDEDVPSDVTDLAAYEQGAHDAAEAIRAIARTDGAGS